MQMHLWGGSSAAEQHSSHLEHRAVLQAVLLGSVPGVAAVLTVPPQAGPSGCPTDAQ
jgi:hypothetical protein